MAQLQLWVDNEDSTGAWTTVGSAPYLSAQDQPSNYIHSNSRNANSGVFSFPASGKSTETINSVTLYVYCVHGGATSDFEAYIGATATGLNPGASWGWVSIDVSSILTTWAQIDAATVYFDKPNTTNDPSVDACYLLVDYEPPGLQITPSPASTIVSVVAPSVVEAVYITPTNVSAIVSVVAPSVYEPEYATPSPASVVVGSVIGGVYEPEFVDNPIASTLVSSTNPTVIEAVYITPSPISVIASVVAPSVIEAEYITPSFVSVVTGVTAPSVYTPETVSPSPSSVIVDTIDPSVVSDLLITPNPASVIVRTYYVSELGRIFGPAWQSG